MEQRGVAEAYLKAAVRGRRPSGTSECLDEEHIVGFYSGALGDAEMDRVREHIADCASCLVLAREARQFLEVMNQPVQSAAADTAAAVERSARLESRREPWWLPLASFFSFRPAVGLAMAAAMMAMLIGGSVLMISVGRLRNEIDRARAGEREPQQRAQELRQQLAEQIARNESLLEQLRREQAKTGELERQLASSGREQPGKASALTAVASLVLASSLVRDVTEANTLVIPQGTSLVRLHINLDEDAYKDYRAVIRTADGDEVWEGKRALRPNKSKSIVVTLSPEHFVKRDHVLRLLGVTSEGNREDIGQYVFRVVKR